MIKILILLLILVSCKNNTDQNLFSVKNNNNNNNNNANCESLNESKRIFTLDGYNRAEFISYPDRIAWDSSGVDEIIVDHKINIDSTFFKERIVLNSDQLKKLNKLLSSDFCNNQNPASAACYIPRNLLLLKDDKNKVLAHVEFCFGCCQSRYSRNIVDFQQFCIKDMQNLFLECGIKYFGLKKEELESEYKLHETINLYKE